MASTRRRPVRRLCVQEVADRRGERERLFARDERDVGAEDSFSSSPPGLSAREHRRAARQRLDRDGRQRLENRRQHEQIGGRAVAGDDGVVHQARERHVPLARRPIAPTLQLVEQRSRAADHETRVGVVRITSFIASSK